MELKLPKMLVVMHMCLFANALHQENSICQCHLAHKMGNCVIEK